ncbi:MAG: hypothetical protein J7501_02155 [Bdellovibrio sp.]|nr:hypothetical protein [Bdellovibrio sp.]
MSKRKKKSSPAENLIESLMEDVREIQADSSIHKDAKQSAAETRVEESSSSDSIDNMWESLEKDVGSDLDSAEFDAGYSSDEQGDGYEDSIKEEFTSDEDSVYESGNSYDMPEGFSSLPPSERVNVSFDASEGYNGPSADGGYQSHDEVHNSYRPSMADEMEVPMLEDDSTSPVQATSSLTEDKTISIQDLNLTAGSATGTDAINSNTDADKTLAVTGFANARVGGRKQNVDVKVSVGNFRGSSRTGAANVMTSVDASLAQAENLKIAQQRILELEREVESLRAENEELASAGEIIRTRTDELGIRITSLEKEKVEIQESAQSEMLILKGNLQYKENEVAKARIKVDELETRLKSDFKKIRVRERELENRLELLRAEKAALVRSKDEYILDQKRKIDQLSQELDNYRKKCLELNKTIEGNQDQFKRTERALRLALSNLEVKEESLVPLKKAE